MRHPCLTWWPQKVIAATADMTPIGAAFYRVLLEQAWVQDGSLPDNDNKLRLITRLGKKQWDAIRNEVRSKFTLGEDGRLHHPLMDAEWQRAERRKKMAEEKRRQPPNGAAQNDPSPKPCVTKKQRDNRDSETIWGTRSLAQNPMISTCARGHDPTPTPTLLDSLSYDRENLEGAPASLSVRAHASPALSPNGQTEPPQPPDDAARARIAAGLEELARSLANPDRLNEPAAETVAELQRQAAAEKLAQWAANPLPALSPAALASPRLGYVNGHNALPKALPAQAKRKRRTRRANGGGT